MAHNHSYNPSWPQVFYRRTKGVPLSMKRVAPDELDAECERLEAQGCEIVVKDGKLYKRQTGGETTWESVAKES